MPRRAASAVLVALTALAVLVGVPRPGWAHVVVQPAKSEAGGWERYSVLVPTEKASPTVRVEVRLPVGMEIVAVEAKPGWEGTYEPFPIGAARVQWKGGRIPEHQFLSFDFLAWNPPKAGTIAWEAVQYYEDGSSDRWGGPGGDASHASTTTLAPASVGHAHRRHGTAR